MNTSNPPTEATTLIEFILDETGSMSSVKSAAIAGYNYFVTEQQAQTGDCYLTLTKFDSRGIRTPFTDLNIHSVIPMTDDTFVPGSMTNLRDAIVARTLAVSTRLAQWNEKPNVLIIVLTDGDDNASVVSIAEVLKTTALHTEQGFTFAFLGSTSRSLQTAHALGFLPGNSKQFEISQIEETMSSVSAATTVYRSTRTHATTAESNYFSK